MSVILRNICFCVTWEKKYFQVMSLTRVRVSNHQNFTSDIIDEYLLEKTIKQRTVTLPGPPPPPVDQDSQPVDPPSRSRRSGPVLVSRGAAPHVSLSAVTLKRTKRAVVVSVARATSKPP